MKRFVCISGVSSGLGRHATSFLIDNGFHVIGTVRNAADREELLAEHPENCDIVIADVTNESDIQHLTVEVNRICGSQGLFGLVNNAGIVASGPIVHLTTEALAHQLDVNVLGVHRLTTSLFPLLRKSESARIVNISSVSGMISFPFTGAYATSKFALEAYSDALRRELAPYDIPVVVIQPAATKTAIWSKNLSVTTDFAHTAYHRILKRSGKIFERSEEKGMEPLVVSKAILDALKKASPKTRYLIAPHPLMMRILGYWMPTTWLDRIMRKQLFEKNGESLMDFSKGSDDETP